MEIEELQKAYEALVNKVRRMRGVQKEYFKYRASSDLKLSKRLEGEVDQIISKEVSKKATQQVEIF